MASKDEAQEVLIRSSKEERQELEEAGAVHDQETSILDSRHVLCAVTSPTSILTFRRHSLPRFRSFCTFARGKVESRLTTPER